MSQGPLGEPAAGACAGGEAGGGAAAPPGSARVPLKAAGSARCGRGEDGPRVGSWRCPPEPGCAGSDSRCLAVAPQHFAQAAVCAQRASASPVPRPPRRLACGPDAPGPPPLPLPVASSNSASIVLVSQGLPCRRILQLTAPVLAQSGRASPCRLPSLPSEGYHFSASQVYGSSWTSEGLVRGQKVLLCPGIYIPMDETISHTRTPAPVLRDRAAPPRPFGSLHQGPHPLSPVSSPADWLVC